MNDYKKALVKSKQGIELSEYDKLVLSVHKEKKVKKPKSKPPKKKKKKSRLKVYKGKYDGSETKHEKLVRIELEKEGLNFKPQVKVSVNKKQYIMDFYFPNKKLCVEIDGFHHYHEPQKSIDILRTKRLNSVGIKVVRFNNKEVENDMHLVICTIKIEYK